MCYRPLDTLVPYAPNGRTRSEAQVAEIARSIREFGFTNPVLISGDGALIAGHGRVLATRKLGMETVPTIVLSGLSESAAPGADHADSRNAITADGMKTCWRWNYPISTRPSSILA